MAVPERVIRPQLVAAAHEGLRSVLAEDYAAFTESDGPRHVVLPASSSVAMIVKLEDSAHRPSAFVMGPRSRYVELEGACAPSYLRVLFGPLGAYSVLGRPLDDLAGQVVDVVDLFGSAGAQLVDRIRDAPDWTHRRAVLDELLLRRLACGPSPTPEVRQAWRRIVASSGRALIGDVAAGVGWSHKHLITKFRQQVGQSPKTVARLVRMERVWRSLDHAGAPRWGEISAESGYADQAHLIHDFREFVGTTPTAYVERLRQPEVVGDRR
jgi:AraC-like DNA-binding protein